MYWCEGTKADRGKNYDIEFVSSDSKMIQLFLDFLRRILKINNNKLRGRVKIYKDQNLDEIEKFWSKKSNISKYNFFKPIIRNRKSNNKKHRGTFTVRYSDKKKYEKLLSMIKNIQTS